MTTFTNRVYTLLCTVPKGRVTTYKALANALGSTAYRAIGQSMRHNPFAPEVPCHRVVSANGTLGGFMGSVTGIEIEKKIQLLRSEGITISENRIVNFNKVFYGFS